RAWNVAEGPVLLPSRIAKARIAKRRGNLRADLDSWPTLGLAITLLVIFMLLPGNSPHGILYANLPITKTAASQPRANREDAMRTVVARDGAVFFRNMKVGLADLPELIRDAVKNGAERRVYLVVDSRAKYGDVKAVVGLIDEAGIRDVTFLVEKR